MLHYKVKEVILQRVGIYLLEELCGSSASIIGGKAQSINSTSVCRARVMWDNKKLFTA